MTFDAFVKLNQGKYLEFPGTSSALYQCVDLMRYFIHDVWALDPYIIPRAATAKLAYDYARTNSKITKIPNTPDGIPQKGDILFFKMSLWPPFNFGWAGHVGIVYSADLYKMVLFNQNWPTGRSCQFQSFSYKDCMGWIHKK